MAAAPFSIANLFRSGNNAQSNVVAQSPQLQSNTPQKTPVGNMDNQPTNPDADPMNQNLGDAGLGEPKKKADSSPLDDFGDIFKIDDKKALPTDPLAEKLFNFDQTKFMAAVDKMNFAGSITPETMQKIQSGDTTALTTALQGTGKTAFASAIQMLLPIMESSITKNNARFKSILAAEVRNVQIGQGRPENEALNHPAAAPVLGALKTQISSQFPDLTPSEVTKKAEDYFLAMSKAINSKLPQDKNSDGSPKKKESLETDFSNFLDI